MDATSHARVQTVAFLGILIAILAPDPVGLLPRPMDSTIYPWWALLLGVTGLVASQIARRGPLHRAPAAEVAIAVVAAPLVGLGIVGWKHWIPAIGMGGPWPNQVPFGVLRTLALVIAALALLAAALAVRSLVVLRCLPTVRTRAARARALVCGAGLTVAVPLVIGAGHPDNRDVTSLGAYALIYSLPWAVTVAATGFVETYLARVALLTGAGTALLALVGPSMADLVYTGAYRAAAMLALALMIALWGLERRSASPARTDDTVRSR